MSYAQVREKVRLLIEGDDIGSTFSTDTLDLIISMAEGRVYRNLRADTMYVASAALNATSNVLAIPAGLMELDRIVVGGKDVELTDMWRVQQLIDGGSSQSDTLYAAQRGPELLFYPSISNSTSIYLYYYGKPTALALGENTTYLRYPELFLYAAVAEASPYLGEDSRAPMWEAKYAQALQDANANERWRAYGGTSLRIRNR
jgi:hypothetical protein